jgi:hypothetical protein
METSPGGRLESSELMAGDAAEVVSIHERRRRDARLVLEARYPGLRFTLRREEVSREGVLEALVFSGEPKEISFAAKTLFFKVSAVSRNTWSIEAVQPKNPFELLQRRVG